MKRLLPVMAAVAFLAGSSGRPVMAGPKGPGPHLAKYGFNCWGVDVLGRPAGEVGVIEFTSSTAAIGSAMLNLGPGSIVQFTTFNATIINGTADSQGTGGNGIPTGCFTGTATFSGDTFGVNSQFFGCFNHNSQGFDWVSRAPGNVTCRGTQM